jgi:NifU-like protein involved in Fe-S cluster formation
MEIKEARCLKMLELNEKIKGHFRNPQNVGEIENPEGKGAINNPVCGDTTKLYLRTVLSKLGKDFIASH